MSERRRPAPLLPVVRARLVGLVLLTALGAVEWRRMLEDAAPGRTVAWVGLAVAAALLALLAGRLSRRARVLAGATLALPVAAAIAVAAAVPRELLAPRAWDDLAIGLTEGARTLTAVTLPYAGADPWPPLALEIGGAALCVAAGLLALWPRKEGPGFPFLSLGTLLVLVVWPVVALGSPHAVPLGLALAALAVAFLWLERLPLRPGLGVVVLGGVALAGALPLGSAADRDVPWWDYQGFAASLHAAAPVRFTWDQDYSALSWPRDGRELLRVRAREAHYWKVANLEEFDGQRWAARGTPHPGGFDPEADLPPEWEARRGWTGEVRVTVRGLDDDAFVAPGTSLAVTAAPARALPTFSPGRFAAERVLRPGDSYAVRFHDPRPSPGRLATATSGQGGAQEEALSLTIPLGRATQRAVAPDRRARTGFGRRTGRDRRVSSAEVVFAPFGTDLPPVAFYERLGRAGSGERVLRDSSYARTWRLARRLRRGARTPYALVRRIDAQLERGFRYAEAPPPVPRGRAPLDAFLTDTRAGFCQHFSGAMALLLRMSGVPARVASGFSAGGRRSDEAEWIVRDRDAHAWVEVWFDDLGWVAFDPTPAAAPARARLAELEGEDTAAAAGAEVSSSATPQGRNPAGLLRDLDPAASGGAGPGVAAEAEDPGGRSLVPVLAAVLALALVAGALLRSRVPVALPGEDAAIAELRAALRLTGRDVPPRATLREIETRLGGSAYVRRLQDARYGPDPTPPSRADRRAFRRELTAGLGPLARVRALWAVPPWRPSASAGAAGRRDRRR